MLSRRPNRGFTLLEVIAALAIMGITLGYLLVLREANMETSLNTHDERMARFLCRGKLEEVLLESIEKVGTSGKFEKVPGYRWEAGKIPLSPIEGVQVQEITVTVYWGEEGANTVLKGWIKAPKQQDPSLGGAGGGLGGGGGGF